tara:strand:- start:31098 stop:31319 length:222 start_codon:yes stop_codon:yes gene_type:complete
MKNTILTEDAIEYFGGRHRGGVVKLAEALGITHGAVSQWGQYVPELQAYKLKELCGDGLKISRQDQHSGQQQN